MTYVNNFAAHKMKISENVGNLKSAQPTRANFFQSRYVQTCTCHVRSRVGDSCLIAGDWFAPHARKCKGEWILDRLIEC